LNEDSAPIELKIDKYRIRWRLNVNVLLRI